MIKVDRTSLDSPKILTEPDDHKIRGGRSSSAKEMRKAQESLDKWIADGKAEEKWSYKFKIYRDEEIKDALTELFHGKCAYCETLYAALQPMDVEHWRPKGQVFQQGENGESDSYKKPAYYWLAAEWTNLLPSCIDCNRERYQTNAISKEKELSGKKDHFPIREESKRASVAEEIEHEEPLLLNPCSDQPVKVIEFNTEEAIVQPIHKSGKKHDMAQASIRVYGLNRSELVLNRKEHLRIVQFHIKLVKNLARILLENDDLPDSVEVTIEELMLDAIKHLVDARSSERPYAMLTRQVIREEMSEFIELGLEDAISVS